MRKCLLAGILFSLCACASRPFPPVVLAPLSDVDPSKIVDRLQSQSPSGFRVLNTVTFQFRGRELSGMGFAAANVPDKSFQLACMTATGVTLFELSGQGEKIVCHFAMEAFTGKGRFAETVGEDIRKVYFDSIPSAGSDVEIKKDRLVFGSPTSQGRVEQVFGGPGLLLIEKRFFEKHRQVCRVRYYEYQERQGKLLPGGIVLDNFQYHYRLIVRLKQVQEVH